MPYAYRTFPVVRHAIQASDEVVPLLWINDHDGGFTGLFQISKQWVYSRANGFFEVWFGFWNCINVNELVSGQSSENA